MPYIKLYLDEDVHPELAPALRNRGFDVVSTHEVPGRKGSSDLEQIEYAISQERVILTFNTRDYILLYKRLLQEGKNLYGIIVSPHIPIGETLQRI